MFRIPFRFFRFLFAVSAIAALGTASAFPIGPRPPPVGSVFEYFNSTTNHFFYTIDPVELAFIDSGGAGPGWVRTGHSFAAYASIPLSGDSHYPKCDTGPTPCVSVLRFIGTPGVGPNSHFYTGVPAEIAGLSQPGTGWTYEQLAFAIPMPDPATKQCVPGQTPVYRFYNNRYMYNDSNHRYATSDAVRSRMVAEGWIDEGVVFCTYNAGHSAILLHSIEVSDRSGVQSLAACDTQLPQPRSCVAVGGIAVPAVEYPGGYSSTDEFNARTGIYYMGNAQINANIALLDSSRAGAASDSFVQLSQWRNVFGMHLVAPPGAAVQFSSMAPTVRLPVTAPAGGTPDARVFPFRAHYDTEYEVRLDFTPGIHKLFVDSGSHAFGLAALEFVDSRTGNRFRAHILAYGTVPEGDVTGRDGVDGVIYVATSFKAQSPYGRSFSAMTGHLPADYEPLAPYLAPYIWYVNRTEFQAMVDSARSLDPTLSTNPEDYVIGSFGVRNQIYGSGVMATYLYQASVGLMPR